MHVIGMDISNKKDNKSANMILQVSKDRNIPINGT